MPITNSNVLHIDKYLTNLSIEVPQAGFVADAIFPSFPVTKVTDSYLDWTPASTHRLYDNRITKLEDPKYIEYEALERTYRTVPYALGDLISKEDIDNADSPISLMADSARFLENAMRLAREARVLTAAFNPAIVPAAAASGGFAWNGATGLPIRSIRAAIAAIWTATQTVANAIVIPMIVAIEMLGCTEWLTYYAQTNLRDGKSLFKLNLGLQNLGLEVFISGTCALETDQGTASDPNIFGPMIGRAVLVYTRVARPTRRTRCFGFSPTFYGREVSKEFISRKRAWEIYSREHMDELMIDANCGLWITGV